MFAHSAGFSAMHSTYFMSVNAYGNIMIYSFCRGGNQGLERLNNLSQIT